MTPSFGLATLAAGQEFIMTRIFDAPPERVFKAWTDAGCVELWWGPDGFTNSVCEMDARPGGALRIHMRSPNGIEYPNEGAFQEVVEAQRLVFTTSAFEDEAGVPRLEVLNTVTFAEYNGQTHATLQANIVKAAPELAAALAGMEAGWSQSLDKLARRLGGL